MNFDRKLQGSGGISTFNATWTGISYSRVVFKHSRCTLCWWWSGLRWLTAFLLRRWPLWPPFCFCYFIAELTWYFTIQFLGPLHVLALFGVCSAWICFLVACLWSCRMWCGFCPASRLAVNCCILQCCRFGTTAVGTHCNASGLQQLLFEKYCPLGRSGNTQRALGLSSHNSLTNSRGNMFDVFWSRTMSLSVSTIM